MSGHGAALLFALIMFVGWLVVAYLVGNHASENNIAGGWIWAVVIFFLGFIGLGLYLVAMVLSDGSDRSPPPGRNDRYQGR